MSLAPPAGFRVERLRRDHPRKAFSSGQGDVDDWLRTKALQNQDKRLSSSRVLLGESGVIAGFHTLTTCQIDFSDLPPDAARGLPRRVLPAALLAWLGVSQDHQRRGLGQWLLADALAESHQAGLTFPFVILLVDCVDDRAKEFYRRFDFRELPGRANRLFLSAALVEALVGGV